jgi:hypothetical protein
MIIITEEKTQKTELALYESQFKWLAERYGETAANNANYGWVAETNDESPFVGVATKVYGIGILYSDALNLIEDGGELQVEHRMGPL